MFGFTLLSGMVRFRARFVVGRLLGGGGHCTVLYLHLLYSACQHCFTFLLETRVRHSAKAAIYHCECQWGGHLVKFVLSGVVVRNPPLIKSHASWSKTKCNRSREPLTLLTPISATCDVVCHPREALVRPEIRPGFVVWFMCVFSQLCCVTNCFTM